MSNGQTVDDKSVLLVVDFHKLGNTRKVSMSKVDVDADKSMLHLNKSLLDSPEFDSIRTHDGKTRAWLVTRALPSLFKEGVFRVPNTLIVDVDEYLTQRARQRAELVQYFEQAYPMRVGEALQRLNGLANPKDYLSKEEASAKFKLTWRYVTFATPDALKNLQEGLFERERDKLAKMVEDAGEEIRTVLRVQMAALVKRMVTQLTPTADGKRKKIYDSLTGNIEDFLATFDARNLASDTELQALVERARAVLSGVDPELLRGSDYSRNEVREGFEQINKQLDLMIIDKPARQFDFGGDA